MFFLLTLNSFHTLNRQMLAGLLRLTVLKQIQHCNHEKNEPVFRWYFFANMFSGSIYKQRCALILSHRPHDLLISCACMKMIRLFCTE